MSEIKDFLEKILTYVSENKFSDLHLTTWRKARIRNHVWDLEELNELWEFSKEKIW